MLELLLLGINMLEQGFVHRSQETFCPVGTTNLPKDKGDSEEVLRSEYEEGLEDTFDGGGSSISTYIHIMTGF